MSTSRNSSGFAKTPSETPDAGVRTRITQRHLIQLADQERAFMQSRDLYRMLLQLEELLGRHLQRLGHPRDLMRLKAARARLDP